MNHRSLLGAILGLLLIATSTTWLPAAAQPNLSIEPLTRNVIGLDSTDVDVGPNTLPVGARVCNTGSTAATNVSSALVRDSGDLYINLRAGSLREAPLLDFWKSMSA
ncbi:MAG: hypothetical protein ACLFWD_10485 [Anaerolineales bacterium]